MAKYTVYDKKITDEVLREDYKIAKKDIENIGHPYSEDLDNIFEIALKHKSRFPDINATGKGDPQTYMNSWVKKYKDAVHSLPSNHKAQPKGSCNDPAIRTIVQTTQKINEDEATKMERAHSLFMSAENIQGLLLEEYIFKNIHPYGFIWCAGEVLKAIDFCNPDFDNPNSRKIVFLQIKNKSNTENSSSSTVRNNLDIEITKWYRIGTKTKNKIKYPDYKWDNLNVIINDNKPSAEMPDCKMSEEGYKRFLRKVAENNPELITSE